MDILLTPKQYQYLDNKDISPKAKFDEISTYIKKCRTTKQYPEENRWYQLLHMQKLLLQKGVYTDGFDYGF